MLTSIIATRKNREFIDSLHTMLPLEASKVLFLILLTDKLQAIHNVTAFIRVVLGKQKSVEGTVQLKM